MCDTDVRFSAHQILKVIDYTASEKICAAELSAAQIIAIAI
jgi:hypothetical protein